ncbi:MAG: hypothetical protein JNL28_11540 [Planctomycetes bacterium]|nr:hypothetical protein [Planctomycetota bacterium]
MTRTARRRFTRELPSVVDGVAFTDSGPVLLHVYDPPAGGMWVDDVIPGKLAALDRHTGETLWLSPCEVGYGRGFGAGFGTENDVIVLGPSAQGHRIVRMALSSGELIGVGEIEAFDEAHVSGDLCICVTPRRILAYSSVKMDEAWEYSRPGERYHHAARSGPHVFVIYTHTNSKKQGVLRLDAKSGEFEEVVLGAKQPTIHGIAVNNDGIVLLTRDLATALPREVLPQFLVDLSRRDDDAVGDSLSLLALALDATDEDAPLWYEILSTAPTDEIPEVGIAADSGKLYLVKGALLEVRDTLTGRMLGDWAVPGLDESVGWQVSQGAGLVAEESRVSVYELPA